MTLAGRLAAVRDRIAAAALCSGRSAADVTLVAVSKTHPANAVAAAIAAGATDLGENRVQEGAAKKPGLAAATWHLIGPLQRNKVGLALETFDILHTLDRPELAERLQLLLERDWPDRRLPVLLEVNAGDEPQKAGVEPDEAVELLRLTLSCDRLQPVGLMAIPPFGDEPEASRPYFRRLRELRDRLQETASHPLPQLSMGMSHDYEVAIEEGATIVRVGTAIFGPRAQRSA